MENHEHSILKRIAIGVLIVLLLMAALILFGWPGHDTVEHGQAADPAEQHYPPGLVSIRSTAPVDRAGDYLTIAQGVVIERHRRSGEFSTVDEQGSALYGKPGCKNAWEKITLNSIFGTDLAYTRHNLHFCYDGKRITEHAATRSCDVTGAGALAQWSATGKAVNGWYAAFHGYGQGSWHSWLRCEYSQGAFGVNTNRKQHYSEIVGFSNGGVTWP